jgi:peptidoglycan hydrolase CwlO-like protein
LAQDTVDSRNNDYYDLERDLLKVQNELYKAQNDLDAADDDFEQQKQVIENLTNERDQAVHNLQQQGESQTQPHASLFGARPAAQRLNALRQDRERSQSRQPAERVREPAPRPQTDERALRPSVAPLAALSSLSARPTVRFPNPDIFKGDNTAKYRM